MMNKNTIFGLLLLASAWLMGGCTTATQTPEHYGYVVHGNKVEITDPEWAQNLVTREARETAYSKQITTAGIVRPIPTQYANIAPPFAGRVLKSYVEMGQHIAAGAPMFEINCPDFTAAQKDYFQARSERDLARKDLNRKKDLIRNGATSEKELEEAENALLIAEKELENAEAALRVYEVRDFEHMTLGQPLVVRAPLSGHVIENNIVMGQYFKDDSEPIAVVADLTKVWISAQVKEKDIRYINEDGELEIELIAHPGERVIGKIFHIEEEVDEATRSICVLAACDNPDERFKLGMYATAYFRSDPQPMCEIDETALLQGDTSTYVFVEIAPNLFEKRDVEVEALNNGKALISRGVKAGERVIAEGGYYLK